MCIRDSSNISRSLEELGQSEISTNTIGTMVMDSLKDLDPVGYVRFVFLCKFMFFCRHYVCPRIAQNLFLL